MGLPPTNTIPTVRSPDSPGISHLPHLLEDCGLRGDYAFRFAEQNSAARRG